MDEQLAYSVLLLELVSLENRVTRVARELQKRQAKLSEEERMEAERAVNKVDRLTKAVLAHRDPDRIP